MNMHCKHHINFSFLLYLLTYIIKIYIFIMSIWIVPTVIWFCKFTVWIPWKMFFSYSIGMLLVLIPFYLINKVNKIVIFVCYIVYCIISSFYSVHIILYNMPVSSISIAAIYQTNIIEIHEFIKSYISLKTIAAVLVCWLIPIPFLRQLFLCHVPFMENMPV